MVERYEDIAPGQLDSRLEAEWTALANSQPPTHDFVSTSVKRPLDEGGLVAFFNSKLVITSDWFTIPLGHQQVLFG